MLEPMPNAREFLLLKFHKILSGDRQFFMPKITCLSNTDSIYSKSEMKQNFKKPSFDCCMEVGSELYIRNSHS